MYIEQDFVGPATLDLQAHRKLHNRLLRHWPTKWVNGVEVLDLLFLYNGTVQESPSHKKIYNILGIKVEDLKSAEWTGVENYYIYFNVVQGTYDNLSAAELSTYILFQSPFTVENVPVTPPETPVYDRSEWFESELNYEPLRVPVTDNVLSDSDIIDRIIADPYIVRYSLVDEPVLTALALLDVDEVIFERTFRVTYRNLTEVTFTSQTDATNPATFVKQANVEFKFRRKPETSQLAYDTYLATMVSSITAAQYNVTNNVVKLNLLIVYRSIVPFLDSDVVYSLPPISSWAKPASYYRKAGLQAMKSKEFNKTITSRITTGYTKKKVKWYKKVIAVIVAIIIIYVSFLAGQPAAGAKGAAAAFAWGKASLVLAIGSMAMIGVSVVIAKRDPAWAAYIGKVANVLGIAGTILGVTAFIQQMVKTATASALTKEAVKELAKDGILNAGEDVIKQKAFEMAAQLSFKESMSTITMDSMQDMLIDFVVTAWKNVTSFNMQSMLNMATMGFQAYAKYINPPADGLDDLSRQVKDQKTQLEDLSSAGLKDKIDYAFSSPYYNIYDFNEVMQCVPERMTKGLIDDACNKYYDGVTSKVRYRGYLG